MSLLEVKNLKTYFFTDRGTSRAVDNVSFSLNRGESLGIVGESGCGKSVTALSILRLIQSPPGKIAGGEILLESGNINIDLLKISEEEIVDIRGRRIAMIFQEPMTALNPVFTIGNQIEETIGAHKKTGKKEGYERAVELLGLVGIPAPSRRYESYPHELSGGMRQRVMIAMALALNPEILIADEPTTALDVTIQAQILELIKELQEKLGMALILITHDMGIVAQTVKKVAVMYCGKIVEMAKTEELFNNPLHPYTIGLLRAIPPIEKRKDGVRLPVIPGRVPDLIDLPKGCLFGERCGKKLEDCSKSVPDLVEVETGHRVRCLNI